MSAGAFDWRMCDGKRRYTQEQAEQTAERLNRHRRRRLPPVDAYPCAICGEWHTGCKRHGGRELRRRGY